MLNYVIKKTHNTVLFISLLNNLSFSQWDVDEIETR